MSLFFNNDTSFELTLNSKNVWYGRIFSSLQLNLVKMFSRRSFHALFDNSFADFGGSCLL